MTSLVVDIPVEHFKRVEKLGEGTYGVVYKAIYLPTNQYVAMKKIRLETQEEGVPSTSVREISILRELREHPNIVKLIHVIFPSPLRLFLIFEYFFMDLKKYFDLATSVNPCLVKSYMYQILRALDYCHSRRIFHRDLKPQNLLIDEAGIIKIADFGLARTFSVPMRCYTHEIVTLWYRCPEVLLGASDYSAAVDTWSVGCIFAEMATFEPLFAGDSEIDQLFKIFRILGTPSDSQWPKMKELPNYKSDFPKWKPVDLNGYFPVIQPFGVDLLLKLLSYDPISRIMASDCLNHPYFFDYDSTLLPPVPKS